MKSILTLGFFMIVLNAVYAQNGTKNFLDQNYIELTGSAEQEVIPDRIYIQITISEKDKKGQDSVEYQEQQMLQALQKIDSALTKHISILSYSSTYIRYFFKKSEVTKTKKYELLLKDPLQLAPVFSALDELEVSDVHIVKLDHSEIKKLQQETKLKAIMAAQEKAKNYAKAIHQSIGRALFIKELDALIMQNAVPETNVVLRKESFYSDKRDISCPTIQLKKIMVTAKVLTRFALN